MPIETPSQALTLPELPLAGATEQSATLLVNTDQGAKQMALDSLHNLLIGTYQYYAGRGFPRLWAVPMLGGILNPDDFVDSLAALKQRIPEEWILTDGRVQLPLVFDHVLQQDLSLLPGDFQNDAIRNIKGEFSGGVNGNWAGPFITSGNTPHSIGNASVGAGHAPASRQSYFDVSRAVPTAEKNRENTLNSLLCLFCGQIKQEKVKRYWLLDYMHGEPVGWYIDLAVGVDGHGIGYNPHIMMESEPVELKQEFLRNLYPRASEGDPLALAFQVYSRQEFSFSFFELMYRSFRLDSKDVVFTATMDGIRITGGDGTDSITFMGTPQYKTDNVLMSQYGMSYNCNTVSISSGQFDTLTISGLPTVSVQFRVRTGLAVLSLLEGGRLLDENYLKQIYNRCPQEHLSKLSSWMLRMPSFFYNKANTYDELDSLPMSRFFFATSAFTMPSPSQLELCNEFRTNSANDNINFYDSVQTGFNIADFVSENKRTFWLDGRKMILSANEAELRWTSADGYYMRTVCTPYIGNITNFSGQNRQIVYQSSDSKWFFGCPGIEEINTVRGYGLKMLFIVKENIILFSFAGGFDYFSKSKIEAFINSAPAGKEAEMREIFKYLPYDWQNTMNSRDNFGENWGTKEARFYMKADQGD